ncbi:hypothetical protein [Streptomyces sp. NPDC046821]
MSALLGVRGEPLVLSLHSELVRGDGLVGRGFAIGVGEQQTVGWGVG